MDARSYFKQIALGAFTAAVVYAVLFYVQLGVPVPNGMSRWSAELNRQKVEIAQQKGAGKIVIVGGSSVLFGVRASVIEAQMGRPAVNLGSHAALGLAHLLHVAKQSLRSNDVVVLAFEYELFNEPYYPANQEFLDYVIGHDTGYFAEMPLRAKGNLMLQTPFDRLKQGLKYRFKRIKPRVDPPGYLLSNLNENGDLMGAVINPARTNVHSITNMISDLALGLDLSRGPRRALAEFTQWANAHNIRVFATFPPLLDKPEYRTPLAVQNAEAIRALYDDLRVPVLESYADCLLPLSWFYDTAYHLTAENAELRTERLARALRAQAW